MNYDGLRSCSRKCIELDTECPNTDCRLWIDYPQENNCTLISVNENDSMTLREIGERIGLSFARVKQIEQKALSKIKRFNIEW
ncbi:MAG: hypothetical protein CMC82_04490 [Flavobacteriaceae bacterium]|nr:hypothetical protein [Flavobacteriaceae bacterium]